MSMNAHHCCIVYSNNRDTALKKLNELKEGKDNVVSLCSYDNLRYKIEDEEWMWVRPNMQCRGYRAHKAYVDAKCTYQEVEENIKPYSYCKDEDFKLFNW
jgi:hypothetical protein